MKRRKILKSKGDGVFRSLFSVFQKKNILRGIQDIESAPAPLAIPCILACKKGSSLSIPDAKKRTFYVGKGTFYVGKGTFYVGKGTFYVGSKTRKPA